MFHKAKSRIAYAYRVGSIGSFILRAEGVRGPRNAGAGIRQIFLAGLRNRTTEMLAGTHLIRLYNRKYGQSARPSTSRYGCGVRVCLYEYYTAAHCSYCTRTVLVYLVRVLYSYSALLYEYGYCNRSATRRFDR